MTRFAVVVLGMHRSGTSVLAELLARSGLALPRTTMPSHADNPSGYFESERISAFNKRLLESAGTPWRDWSQVPCQWFLDPRRQVDVAAAASMVRDEYGDAPAILIKDPCMCRLLPLWRQVFGALGIDWSAALIVRHPAEVVMSMAARALDPTSEGSSITNGSKCALLWLRHNLEAESQTREVPRTVVSHAELMSNPHGAMVRLWRDLGVHERVSAPADWPEVVKAVRVEHHRHRQSPSEGADAALTRPCARWLDRMLERMMAAGQPECGAQTKAELDSVRAGLDHACDLYVTARSVEDRTGPDDHVAHAVLRSLVTDAEVDSGSDVRPPPAELAYRGVSVIVPVYRGLEETRRCIASVLRESRDIPFEVIVVDDCSPEPPLSAWLHEQAARGVVRLLVNSSNRGFVASVNAGMRAAGRRDVILLNSDTEVPAGWIARLAHHAHSDPRIGTVTPFSNNATICSWPSLWGGPMPVGVSTAEIDAAFRAANPGRHVDVPTAVGFCMYIRRDCLDAVGEFDEATFGRGYGEENDFCMRAGAQGWRHVLACDTFVFHAGETSFGHGNEARDRALELVTSRHPGYLAAVARHVAEDPARASRNAATVTLLGRSRGPVVLNVCDECVGGASQDASDVRLMEGSDASVLALEMQRDGVLLRLPGLPGHPGISYSALQHDGLVHDLRECGVDRVHVELRSPPGRWLQRMIDRLGVPFDVTVCDGDWLHAPIGGTHTPSDPVAWLLNEAERVSCRSTDARNAVARCAPHARIHHGRTGAPESAVKGVGASGRLTWRMPMPVSLRRPGVTSVLVVPDRLGDGTISPCGHIRLVRPIDAMASSCPDVLVEVVDLEAAVARSADAIVCQRHVAQGLDAVERLVGHCRTHGICLIYDLDDDLVSIPQTHPEADMLRARIPVVMRLLEVADAVWLATPALKRRFGALRPDARVVPNLHDERLWGNGMRVGRAGADPLRIVCMGTATHDADLALLRPVAEELLRRFGPRIRFDVVGMAGGKLPECFRRVEPDSDAATRGYPGFAAWMASQSWDIGVAPLLDDPFNRCKSPIKLLDYAAMGLPVVASRHEAYAEAFGGGKGVSLVENTESAWVGALSRLILDAEARRRDAALIVDHYRRHHRLSVHQGARWEELQRCMRSVGGRTQSELIACAQLCDMEVQALRLEADMRPLVGERDLLRSEADRLRAKAQRLVEERDRLHVQALYLVHAMRAVRSSTSWRLMAPLRALGSIVRSTPWRRASAMREIRESGLFDAVRYVTSHPGQVPQGCDPLRHFLEVGGSAGLSPSPRFDCAHYLATNPDVRASGINPLLHYLRTGRREGRRALPDDVGTETEGSTPTERAGSLRCHVDHLQCNEYGLYVHGWIHAEPLPLRGQIDVTTRSGQTESSALAVGLLRQDVALAHPRWDSAGRAGFMGLSGAPGSSIDRALLTFWRPDGSMDEVLLIDAARAMPQVRRRSWTTLARTALSLVRSGKWEQLHVRLRNLRSQRRLAGARGDLGRAVHALKEQRVLLVIDHSMGGGANVARNRTVEEWLGRGGSAFVLTFLVHDMQFMLELHRSGAGRTDFAVGGLDRVRQALRHARIDEVLYNCAVSLPNATEVPRLIADVVSDHGARLRVEMHDYFPVCPSPFLLDAERRHCGVPSLDVCRACLKANHDPYVSLAGERSIDAWRKRWGALLAMASEIRCFSDASARVVLRAYPGVQARITVVPHKVTGMRPVRVRRSPSDELVVGVIGAIGFHKGSTVVGDLVRAMERDPRRSRVVVIGTLESDCSSARLVQTGPYRHEQLPALVERHGINVGLVPSVWPETFCFVAHEVAAMGLPLVTLDYGAQADLARNYPRGRVSASQDGEQLLHTLWDAASA